MEEVKIEEVKIEEVKDIQTEQPKMTYEQVYQIAVQATQQLDLLQQELNKTRDESLYVRLDFLFKVLNTHTRFSESFVRKCADEIELLLTIPEHK